jgi:antitoxin PrlF
MTYGGGKADGEGGWAHGDAAKADVRQPAYLPGRHAVADAYSRIGSKGQTVIPKAVRQRLGMKTGDLIRFRLTGKDAVTIDKVRPAEDDPFASFAEWTSEEDEKLYRDL